MLKVGLTGGIACGKTVVRAHFESRGVSTLDADVVVHGLFVAGTAVTSAIAEAFGTNILGEDGSVDRKALGAIVFSDGGARKRLESIVHPAVFREIGAFFEAAAARGESLAVVDAALMIETGSYRTYDCIVVAYCPVDAQRARLMARDGLSEEDADRRIASQMPIDEKRRLADYVVDTSGTMDETLERTDEVLAQLRDRGLDRV